VSDRDPDDSVGPGASVPGPDVDLGRGVGSLRQFAESATNAVLEQFGRGLSRVQERRPLPHDLLESEDAYLVVFDVPGAARSDIQVRFLEGAVQVRVDRFRDFHEGFEMRVPGRGLSLDGEADLPDDAEVDPAAAGATLASNGTLQVRVPKSDLATDVAVRDADEDEDEDKVETDAGETDEVDEADDAGEADADDADDE
jgi:HSP20 family molecular chaperone IbpA